jgi:hypothetical protein
MAATTWAAVVVDVNRDNVKPLWPRLQHAVARAAFVALDLEMTGLGDRQKARHKDLALRYQASACWCRMRVVQGSCLPSAP